jgi:hypothetical protein
MLHDRRGKRKAETGAGIEATAQQRTRSATATRSLLIADLFEDY